jgi:hypothetical protein
VIGRSHLTDLFGSTQDTRAGKTVISGGQYIPASAFKALDTSTGLGARIPAAAQSRVKQVNLTQLGLTSAQLGVISTNLAGMELFFKGAALHVARWPNYPNYVLTGNTTTDGACAVVRWCVRVCGGYVLTRV